MITAGIPHGGFRDQNTERPAGIEENNHVIEYQPETGFQPGVHIFRYRLLMQEPHIRMNQEGQSGCKTVFDVAPAYLSALDGAELKKTSSVT